jgi:hypothetical protein
MYQHQVCIGFNKARVVIGSDKPLPLDLGPDTKLMISALDYESDDIKNARAELLEYAEPLCKDVPETTLPPL